MAFWGDDQWKAAQAKKPIVKVFDLDRLREGSYRLTLGGEAIVSTSENDKGGAYQKISDSGTLILKPGVFAYLISEETIYVPANAIGLINVATKEKFKGLTNISGFHADPLYSGKLIFTVFNAGPINITLYHREEVFRLWLSDISPAATKPPPAGYDCIPKDWADRLHGVYPSPFALSGRVQELENQVKGFARERTQNKLFLLGLSILIFPFVAALYGEVFGPIFHDAYERYYHSTAETPQSAAPQR